MFIADVEECLVPILRRNNIAVMDNCRVHMEAIEKAKASVGYLSRYSSYPNQIRLLLQQMQCAPARGCGTNSSAFYSRDRLVYPTLGPSECANDFAHAGHV